MAIQVDEDYEVRQWTLPRPTQLTTAFAAILILAAGRNEDYVKPLTTPAIASEDVFVAPIVPVKYKDPRDSSRQRQIWAWAAANEDYILAPKPFGNSQPWLISYIGGSTPVVTLFQYNDEIVPQSAPAMEFEDDNWSAPVLWTWPKVSVFLDDDVIVPQVSNMEFEEDSWIRPVIWPQVTSKPFLDDDIVVPQVAPSLVFEEDAWVQPIRWPLSPIVRPFIDDEVIVQQAVTSVFEDDSYVVPAIWKSSKWINYLPIEDDFVAPPPIIGGFGNSQPWLVSYVARPAQIVTLYQYNDEPVPQPPAVVYEDDSWKKPIIWASRDINIAVTYFTDTVDIVIPVGPVISCPAVLDCTRVFNTYETVVDFYKVCDNNCIVITFAFIRRSGQQLPQVRFVDDTLGGPYDTIPRIMSADWVDVLFDFPGSSSSIVGHFQYYDHHAPQTINIDIRKLSPLYITIARNRTNYQIRTTQANRQHPILNK